MPSTEKRPSSRKQARPRYDKAVEEDKMLNALAKSRLNGLTISKLKAGTKDAGSSVRRPILDQFIKDKIILRVGPAPYRYLLADLVREHLGAAAVVETREARPDGSVDRKTLSVAYHRLVDRARGNLHVMIATLAEESGVDLKALKSALLAMASHEEAELTIGDFSLASDAERAAAVRWLNRDCLQVRLRI